MGRLRNFQERVVQWGVRRAVHWQVMHTLARVFGLHVHYVLVSSGSRRVERQPPPALPEGYRVRMVAPVELLPHAVEITSLEPGFLERASERGDVCVASFHGHGCRDAQLVGFSFQSTSSAPVTAQLDLRVPPGFRYTYKTWIDPRHRRRNLSQIQNWVRARSPERDDTLRGIWYVETHNYASLLHSLRAPQDRELRMGLIGWLRFGGRDIPFRSRTARWLGIEFVRTGHQGPGPDHRR